MVESEGMKMEIGDQAQVLIFSDWHNCTILAIDDIEHFSGSPIKRFTVEFPDGITTHCGSNSIRERKKSTRPNGLPQ